MWKEADGHSDRRLIRALGYGIQVKVEEYEDWYHPTTQFYGGVPGAFEIIQLSAPGTPP